MKQKRFFVTLLSLLLVICLLVNCSPIQAEATSAVIYGTAAVGAALVAGAVIKGLGVLNGPDPSVFNKVVNDCVDFLGGATSFLTGGTILLSTLMTGAATKYYVPEELVQTIREWLFDTSVVAFTPTGYSIPSVTWQSYALGSLCYYIGQLDFPFYEFLQQCGINDKVMLLGGTSAVFYGFFFDANGVLCFGRFENPYSTFNASYLGMVPLASLTYISARTSSNIYYSMNAAMASANYLTSTCYVIDWNSCPDKCVWEGDFSFSIPCFYKESADTVFSADTRSGLFRYAYDAVDGDFTRLNSLYIPDDFTLGAVSAGVAAGLVAGNVGKKDDSLAVAYPNWYQNSIALPAPGTNTGTGSDADEKTQLPIFPPWDFEHLLGLGQNDIQTGELTEGESGSGSGSGTESVPETDRVTATGLKGWIEDLGLTIKSWFGIVSDKINEFRESVKTWFTSVIDALVNLPSALLAMIRALADHFKWIAFIWDLIWELGNYIAALFGWLPEPMWIMVQTIFVFVGIYKLLGREG